MRGVKLALLAGLALLGVALLLTLLASPMTVAATNKVPGSEAPIGATTTGATYCQSHEALPRGTSAIRIWLDASAGPRVSAIVYSRGRVVASGTRGSVWIGGSFTVPVKPLARTISGTTVCASFRLHDETIVIQGMPSSRATAAHDGRHALAGRMGVEYLRPGTRSWLSLGSEVARRMGLGRTPGGTWIALVALALFASAVALTSRLLLRDLA
jgi:hypothetical protein